MRIACEYWWSLTRRARHLEFARDTRLDEPESSPYADLVSDRWGVAVQLEQERIEWARAGAHLSYSVA